MADLGAMGPSDPAHDRHDPEAMVAPPDLTPAQRAAAASRHPLHVVSAGAGSGKTRVLVERVVALAKEGVSPEHVLAITFTEKAAAELERRLVTRLEREGLIAQRRAAEAAYISTIHGFCARILREWPVASDLDPSFGILDPIDEALFYEERLDELWADEAFARLAEEYGRDRDTGEPALFRIIKQVIATWREMGRTREELERAADPDTLLGAALHRSRAYAARRWREMLERLAGAERLTTAAYVGGKSGEKYARLCELIATLQPDVPRWELAGELWECIGFYTRVRKPEKSEWQRRLEPARKMADAMRKRNAATEEGLERESARRAALVMQWAARVWAAFERYKAERNLLDFQDLQLAALRLLQRTPAALREYRSRFTHILLDEAQDTNPLQYQILRLLWTGENAWFVVGDAKQAIYGFRGADPELFARLTGEAREHVTDLAANFRSRAEILDFVNAAGHAFWDGQPALRFVELEPAYAYLPGGAAPRVELCLVDERERPDGSGPEGIEVAREREARWIAARLQQLHRERFQICDEDPVTRRPVWRDFAWGDAAILVRTSHYGTLRRVLRDAGIPVAVVGGSGFFDGLEVRDLLNGLAVVANPLDDRAVLAALRSPLCGVDDDALLALRAARRSRARRRSFWEAIGHAALQPAARTRLEEFQDTVRELRALRDALPPSELLHRLIARTDYRAHLFAGDHPRARAANVAKLEALARAHDEMSLREFLEYAARAAAHLTESPDAPLAEPGDQVVTLCTLHRAKGLEWPVVFLADLARDYWRGAEHSGVSPDGSVLLSVAEDARAQRKAWQTPLSIVEQREALDAGAAAEAKRLFYVGATRARELLIMSGVVRHRSARRERPNDDAAKEMQEPLPWLCAQLGLDGASSSPPAPEGVVPWGRARVRVVRVDSGVEPRPHRTAPARSLAQIHAERLRDGLPLGDGQVPETLLARLARHPVEQRAAEQVSVTRLAGYLRCELVYRFSELGLPEYPARPLDAGSASGASFGDALHAALERADFSADPAREAARLAAETGLGGEDLARARRLIEAALQLDVAEEIRRASEVRREVPFYVPLAGDGGADTPILHGIIDLIFRDAAGAWHLVDWKSNAIRDERRFQLLVEQYTRQVQLYAAALRTVPGVERIASGRLVFLHPGRVAWVPVTGDALGDVLARARMAAERIGRGDYATQPGLKCVECGYQRGKWCAPGVQYVANLRAGAPTAERAAESDAPARRTPGALPP